MEGDVVTVVVLCPQVVPGISRGHNTYESVAIVFLVGKYNRKNSMKRFSTLYWGASMF